jgi:Asp-tRNA(Asn)/Glu-tRNA(Gln) amidotransferase B subunit
MPKNFQISQYDEPICVDGYVDVEMGAIKVVNEDLARSITVSSNTNDVRIKAVRTAAVHFEPCCHYAVRVNYTSTV